MLIILRDCVLVWFVGSPGGFLARKKLSRPWRLLYWSSLPGAYSVKPLRRERFRRCPPWSPRSLVPSVRPGAFASPCLIPEFSWLPGGVATAYSACAAVAGALICAIAIARLRVWNPSQQVRAQAQQIEDSADLAQHTPEALASAATWKVRSPRHVWTNPVLWRENVYLGLCRKLLVIRLVYILLFAVAMFGLYWSVESGVALQRSRLNEELIPAATRSWHLSW